MLRLSWAGTRGLAQVNKRPCSRQMGIDRSHPFLLMLHHDRVPGHDFKSGWMMPQGLSCRPEEEALANEEAFEREYGSEMGFEAIQEDEFGRIKAVVRCCRSLSACAVIMLLHAALKQHDGLSYAINCMHVSPQTARFDPVKTSCLCGETCMGGRPAAAGVPVNY